MERTVFILILSFSFFLSFAQDSGKLKKKEAEKNKAELKKAEIRKLIENRDFVFNATEMLPRGLGIVSLGYDFDVQVKRSILISYLPFMGKTYSPNVGSQTSGFDFTAEIQDFKIRKRKKGYKIDIGVKTNSDQVNFDFYIMHSGFATLTVASSKRQSIAYYGTIDPVK